jgi:4-phospho-D-threonate 3-dehydrogenase / 4-phospho-D-erythronate 3-dehydrogenase
MMKPVLAISAGDPAGIGPEISAMALNHSEIYAHTRPLVICDPEIIRQAVRICGLGLQVEVINEPGKGKYTHGTIDVLGMNNVDMQDFQYGKISSMCGRASFEYVEKAISLAMRNEVDATVTGPINKEALYQAGIKFPGHTEIYAHFTGSSNYAMMLADESFRVVHVSTHVSMLEAIRSITRERVLNVIRLADQALKSMGIDVPRIAVNGLNPHAGEHGLFGSEEIDHIIPAIEAAQQEGIMVDGPHPPDTIFPKMKGGQYDIVVCMYHDQGHIPTKLTGFRYNHEKNIWEGMSGVNITLGLPLVRVSVDHGTAFDRAGKGTANPESMMQAIHYAAKLSETTKK